MIDIFSNPYCKGPFIADQTIRWLDAPSHKRLDCLDPKRFRIARMEVEDGKRESSEVELPEGCQWKSISTKKDREGFLTDMGNRKLCLMIEAGIGKTTAVQQLAYLRSTVLKGHLVIAARFANLPSDSDEYLDQDDRSWMVRRFCDFHGMGTLDKKQVLPLLRRLIRQKRLTLIVDAMDQIKHAEKPRELARGLAGFLERYEGINVVVAGRPTAVIGFKEELFQTGEWTFAQVAEFSKEQQQAYIGDGEKMKALSKLEAELLSQPRALEAIRSMTQAELLGVASYSDLMWRVLYKTLVKAIEISNYHGKLEKILRCFSGIAFQLHTEENFNGIDNAQEAGKFMKRLFEKRGEVLNLGATTAEFEEEVTSLSGVNELIDYAVLESTGETSIYFRNRTIQDFLAALWVTRYSCDSEEVTWLEANHYVRGALGRHFQGADRYLFWKFAVEMPHGTRDDVVYVHAVSSLYAPNRFRSTEMIFRSWLPLMHVAGRVSTKHVSEEEVSEAIAKLQREVREEIMQTRKSILPKIHFRWFRHLAKERSKITDPSFEALKLLKGYLGEFIELVEGKRGNSKEKAIAREFDESFLTIPAGTYWYGDEDPVERVLEKGFLMSKYPTMNKVMRLFDPNHEMKERFSDYAKYSLEPNCPAIYCDWYTSWSASVWLHGRLPEEEGWERACRDDIVPPDLAVAYQFGGEVSDLNKVAWWQGNSINMTHSMGTANDREPNSYGMYHMLGSVLEYTRSWYDDDRKSRVLRGGCFSDLENYCRAGFRFDSLPSYADYTFGFRISRAEL